MTTTILRLFDPEGRLEFVLQDEVATKSRLQRREFNHYGYEHGRSPLFMVHSPHHV